MTLKGKKRIMKNNIDERIIWLNGKLIEANEAKMNVMTPSFQFGANVFEGIRCYWNSEKNALYGFRLEDHYKRLMHSIKLFQMESQYCFIDFLSSLKEVVIANGYKEDIAIRQTVFIDGDGSWFSKGPVGMFVAPVPKSRRKFENYKPITCKISSWERISDKNISPRTKTGANYINSRMAQLEAMESGYDSAILLNDSGKVAEGPGSCLFIVRDRVLITPNINSSILESITRDTLLILAKDLGINVIEREVERTELYIADEAFLCGSAMEIQSINNIDGYIISDTNIGEITKKLLMKYQEVFNGDDLRYSSWLTSIYDK